MAYDTIKKFEVDNTVYFECVYRSADGALYDPVNPTWKITNTKGATTASGSPSKREDGIWYFLWTPVNTGDYLLEFAGTIDENPVIIRRKFKVILTCLQ